MPNDLILKHAALLHDVGKLCAKITEGGIDHFKGHNKKSIEIAHDVLKKLQYDDENINQICILVEHHDLPTESTIKGIEKTARIVGPENI